MEENAPVAGPVEDTVAGPFNRKAIRTIQRFLYPSEQSKIYRLSKAVQAVAIRPYTVTSFDEGDSWNNFHAYLIPRHPGRKWSLILTPKRPGVTIRYQLLAYPDDISDTSNLIPSWCDDISGSLSSTMEQQLDKYVLPIPQHARLLKFGYDRVPAMEIFDEGPAEEEIQTVPRRPETAAVIKLILRMLPPQVQHYLSGLCRETREEGRIELCAATSRKKPVATCGLPRGQVTGATILTRLPVRINVTMLKVTPDGAKELRKCVCESHQVIDNHKLAEADLTRYKEIQEADIVVASLEHQDLILRVLVRKRTTEPGAARHVAQYVSPLPKPEFDLSPTDLSEAIPFPCNSVVTMTIIAPKGRGYKDTVIRGLAFRNFVEYDVVETHRVTFSEESMATVIWKKPGASTHIAFQSTVHVMLYHQFIPQPVRELKPITSSFKPDYKHVHPGGSAFGYVSGQLTFSMNNREWLPYRYKPPGGQYVISDNGVSVHEKLTCLPIPAFAKGKVSLRLQWRELPRVIQPMVIEYIKEGPFGRVCLKQVGVDVRVVPAREESQNTVLQLDLPDEDLLTESSMLAFYNAFTRGRDNLTISAHFGEALDTRVESSRSLWGDRIHFDRGDILYTWAMAGCQYHKRMRVPHIKIQLKAPLSQEDRILVHFSGSASFMVDEVTHPWVYLQFLHNGVVQAERRWSLPKEMKTETHLVVAPVLGLEINGLCLGALAFKEVGTRAGWPNLSSAHIALARGSVAGACRGFVSGAPVTVSHMISKRFRGTPLGYSYSPSGPPNSDVGSTRKGDSDGPATDLSSPERMSERMMRLAESYDKANPFEFLRPRKLAGNLLGSGENDAEQPNSEENDSSDDDSDSDNFDAADDECGSCSEGEDEDPDPDENDSDDDECDSGSEDEDCDVDRSSTREILSPAPRPPAGVESRFRENRSHLAKGGSDEKSDVALAVVSPVPPPISEDESKKDSEGWIKCGRFPVPEQTSGYGLLEIKCVPKFLKVEYVDQSGGVIQTFERELLIDLDALASVPLCDPRSLRRSSEIVVYVKEVSRPVSAFRAFWEILPPVAFGPKINATEPAANVFVPRKRFKR